MHITLHGIVSEVLGGYICLRGFAKISDLISISEPKFYQRDIIKEHISDIKSFYEKGKYLFFPEIILGCNLNSYKYSENLRNNEIFSSKGIKYKYLKTEGQGYITIDTDFKLLQRIDGNHRLEAYQPGVTAIEEIPFCILFLAEQQRYKDAKAIFNNINYKHKPLRQEDNLKNIFDETTSDSYTDMEIESDYGINYKKAKYLIKELEANNHHLMLSSTVNEYYREICLNIVNILDNMIKDKEYLNTENIYNAIVDVLKSQKSKIDQGLFIPYVYYKLLDQMNKEDKNYQLFNNWIQKNNLTKIKEMCSEDVIKIFNSILTRKKRQIFVSMPFGHRNCDNMFDAVIRVVEKISKKYNIETPLVLRIDELQQSSTFKIIDKIENAIEDTGYLIAILNHCNPNVYHEIGYAMGYFRGKGLNENILLVLEEPEDSEKLNDGQYKVGFNLQGYKQLRFKLLTEFEQELEKKLLIHYGLK